MDNTGIWNQLIKAKEVTELDIKEAYKIEEMTAKCINPDGIKDLTLNKEYLVKQNKHFDNYYDVVNDIGVEDSYKKYRFATIIQRIGITSFCDNGDIYFENVEGEKMEEVKKVECIDNERNILNLTVGKEYILEKQDKCFYYVKNDFGLLKAYYKGVFKPVDHEKEVREYTVQEIYQEEEGTIFKNEEDAIFYVENGTLYKTYEKGEKSECLMNKRWFETSFIKIEPKPVSTPEAFKALGEGKEVQSLFSKMHYKVINNKVMSKGKHEGEEFELSDYISNGEMKEQWIIEGDK